MFIITKPGRHRQLTENIERTIEEISADVNEGTALVE